MKNKARINALKTVKGDITIQNLSMDDCIYTQITLANILSPRLYNKKD